MTDPLGAIPAELRTVADHLTDVSSQVKDVFRRMNAQLADEGAPWGDDSSGKEFADGAQGYLAQLDWVNGAIAAKTGLLDAYAQSMNKSANAFETYDEQPNLPSPDSTTSPALPREMLQQAGPTQVLAASGTSPALPREMSPVAPSGRPDPVLPASGASPALPRSVELPAASGRPDPVLAASADQPALPREMSPVAAWGR